MTGQSGNEAMSVLLEAARAAGLVGQGGAGFPAHVKYAARVDTVIANGCECEPLLATDQYLMRAFAPQIAHGLQALARAVGASRAVVAVKAKHEAACLAMQGALEEPLELVRLGNFYPAGDEHILVREVLGQSIPPLGLPKQIGALVANVGTLLSLSRALSGQPVTDKALTVSGEVARPGVIEAPLGTSLGLCLDYCRGSALADPVYLIGGPMMGRFIETRTELDQAVLSKTTGAIIVLPRGHYLHQAAKLPLSVMRKQAASACIQCRYCTDLCPRYLVGHSFKTHQVMRAFAAGLDTSEAARQAVMCCECGLCELVSCPMRLSPRRVNAWLKTKLRGQGLAYAGPREILPEQAGLRDYRKSPSQRLTQKIGLAKYADLHPEFSGSLKPDRVSLPLSQHLGAPALALVKPGDRVEKGQLIGEIPETALGARVHASLSGVVASVDTRIAIKGA